MGDCILWTGYVQPNGYGRRKVDGRSVLAHRHAYEQVHGPLAPGEEVDHICFVKACINPEHLRALDRGPNARRHPPTCACSVHQPERRRRNVCRRGHDKRVTGRDSKGGCLACRREHNREVMRRIRAARQPA